MSKGVGITGEGSWLDRRLEAWLGSGMFSYRQVFSMLLPLILDSFFICLIGILTTAMISSSSQESVSAVSLVSPLYMLIYAVYNAISAGGTVVVARLKGRGETERMKAAAGQLLFVTPLAATAAAVALIVFAGPLVHALFRGVEEAVLAKAEAYLIGTAIASVFLALYMGAFAVFRGLGETKTCLWLTILINLLHFLLSFVFINLMTLDILGSVLSLNLARLVGSAAAVWALMGRRSKLRVEPKHIFRLDPGLQREIFRIGVPFGMEQLFMNGGGMLVQIYIARLGSISIAANAIGLSALSLVQAASQAVANLAVTIVGQCVGAGERTLVKRYGRGMVSLGAWLVALSLVLMVPAMPWILKLYQAPSDTLSMIYRVMTIACVAMPLFWPTSVVMPCVMRAAGDAAFPSYFALVTMWVIRVGLGYVLALPMGLGLTGVWLGMCLEWAVRAVVLHLRFRSPDWANHSYIG